MSLEFPIRSGSPHDHRDQKFFPISRSKFRILPPGLSGLFFFSAETSTSHADYLSDIHHRSLSSSCILPPSPSDRETSKSLSEDMGQCSRSHTGAVFAVGYSERQPKESGRFSIEASRKRITQRARMEQGLATGWKRGQKVFVS